MDENQRSDILQQPLAVKTRRLSNDSSSSSCKLDEPPKRRHEFKLRSDSLRMMNSVVKPRHKTVTTDQIVEALKKKKSARTETENKMLLEWSSMIPKARAIIKTEKARNVLKQRAAEQEESSESLEHKADILARMIHEAKYIVIYTGAGISTSASIPDYRGPNGLWTQIKKTGKFSITKVHDLSSAEPTLTHMAISELCRRRVVNHVVSQNCDGLHLRSGIPQTKLSEIHGNMYIEVCPSCERQYFRQADITERTSRFRHKTYRKCHTCLEPNNNLIDTIVLYGERSRTKWPMNWERASQAAAKADLIICLGSSLKTLRRYECLWPKTICNSSTKTPVTKLAIINLQYTSKDRNAVLKINGKCDYVMQLVMRRLNIDVPNYNKNSDPLQHLAVPFTPQERSELKRNLIFEPKPNQTYTSPTLTAKVNLSTYNQCESPNLFISELTNNSDGKELKMRIKSINVDTGSPDVVSSTCQNEDESAKAGSSQFEEQDERKPDIQSELIKHSIPGWLGKSLGNSRTSSYRRKRHGNKGRKHPSALKTS